MSRGWKPQQVKDLERREAEVTEMDRRLREAVAGRMSYQDVGREAVRGWLGLSTTTYYKRLREPDSFTLKEIRTLCRELKLDDQQIASFMRAERSRA